jgi:hypothetical protein
MMLVDFEGNVSPAQGAICVEITIGSKTLPTAFLSLKGGDLIIYYWVGIQWRWLHTIYNASMHHLMDQRFSGGGPRRIFLDNSSYRSTRTDLWLSKLHIWKNMGYQVSQSVQFWTKAGSSSRLWWQDLTDQFIEDEGKLELGITAADGLVAQVYQQLCKPIVLLCQLDDWVFELQPIANVIVSSRIADICKESPLVQKM